MNSNLTKLIFCFLFSFVVSCSILHCFITIPFWKTIPQKKENLLYSLERRSDEIKVLFIGTSLFARGIDSKLFCELVYQNSNSCFSFSVYALTDFEIKQSMDEMKKMNFSNLEYILIEHNDHIQFDWLANNSLRTRYLHRAVNFKNIAEGILDNSDLKILDKAEFVLKTIAFTVISSSNWGVAQDLFLRASGGYEFLPLGGYEPKTLKKSRVSDFANRKKIILKQRLSTDNSDLKYIKSLKSSAFMKLNQKAKAFYLKTPTLRESSYVTGSNFVFNSKDGEFLIYSNQDPLIKRLLSSINNWNDEQHLTEATGKEFTKDLALKLIHLREHH